MIQKTAHRFQEDSEGGGRGIGKPSFCGQPKGKGNGGKSKNHHQMNKRTMKIEAMELKGEVEKVIQDSEITVRLVLLGGRGTVKSRSFHDCAPR